MSGLNCLQLLSGYRATRVMALWFGVSTLLVCFLEHDEWEVFAGSALALLALIGEALFALAFLVAQLVLDRRQEALRDE